MKRSVISYLLIMLFISAGTTKAQTSKLREVLENAFPFSKIRSNWKDYSLYTQKVRISTSLFSKVEVIDNRFDTSVIGFVREGNYYTFIAASSQALKEEITTTANRLISNARKQEGTILINIRKFYLSENAGNSTGYNTKSEGGRGKFIFKAGCYLKQDTFYKLMFTVDAMVRAKSYDDATYKLMDTVRGTLGAFIQQASGFNTAECGQEQFTAWDLQHIDELEKREIPVYTATLPKRGVYDTWEDFKNNQPTREKFTTVYRKGFKRPFVYEMTDNNKKGKEILRRDYYAVCDGENLFISAIYGLFPLTKREGDFYFTIGKKDNAQASKDNMPSDMYDALGGLAPEANTLKVLEYKIDHTTGRFLPIFKQQ